MQFTRDLEGLTITPLNSLPGHQSRSIQSLSESELENMPLSQLQMLKQRLKSDLECVDKVSRLKMNHFLSRA